MEVLLFFIENVVVGKLIGLLIGGYFFHDLRKWGKVLVLEDTRFFEQVL